MHKLHLHQMCFWLKKDIWNEKWNLYPPQENDEHLKQKGNLIWVDAKQARIHDV